MLIISFKYMSSLPKLLFPFLNFTWFILNFIYFFFKDSTKLSLSFHSAKWSNNLHYLYFLFIILTLTFFYFNQNQRAWYLRIDIIFDYTNMLLIFFWFFYEATNKFSLCTLVDLTEKLKYFNLWLQPHVRQSRVLIKVKHYI